MKAPVEARLDCGVAWRHILRLAEGTPALEKIAFPEIRDEPFFSVERQASSISLSKRIPGHPLAFLETVGIVDPDRAGAAVIGLGFL